MAERNLGQLSDQGLDALLFGNAESMAYLQGRGSLPIDDDYRAEWDIIIGESTDLWNEFHRRRAVT